MAKHRTWVRAGIPYRGGAAASIAVGDDWRIPVLRGTNVYGAAILTFLAGVRRGLSFRTEDGPKVAQLATVFAFFALALVSLFSALTDHLRVSAGALAIGYLIAMVADPIAAAKGEAPLFFRRLRSWQMAVALAGAGALFVLV